MQHFFLSVLIAITLMGCSSNPGTYVAGEYDSAEMTAATQRAIDEVDAFIADLKSGRSESYAVKAPIEDNGEIEHIWLIDVTYENNTFTGTINNEPENVTNVKLGDKFVIGKSEISDWLYIRDGKMYGNYTMRPLLPLMPKEEADRFRSMFANP